MIIAPPLVGVLFLATGVAKLCDAFHELTRENRE
jgi:hypothetical protein